jgi:hypothetical protein
MIIPKQISPRTQNPPVNHDEEDDKIDIQNAQSLDCLPIPWTKSSESASRGGEKVLDVFDMKRKLAQKVRQNRPRTALAKQEQIFPEYYGDSNGFGMDLLVPQPPDSKPPARSFRKQRVTYDVPILKKPIPDDSDTPKSSIHELARSLHAFAASIPVLIPEKPKADNRRLWSALPRVRPSSSPERTKPKTSRIPRPSNSSASAGRPLGGKIILGPLALQFDLFQGDTNETRTNQPSQSDDGY